MTPEKSGFLYPNKMARIHVLSIEKTIGHAAVMTLFDTAGIPRELYPPANDFAKAFDFAYYGAIGGALEKMYGHRGERGLMLHAGRAAFEDGLAQYGAITGAGDLTLKAIPVAAKMKIGLKTVAETFNKFSDQLTEVAEETEHFIYLINRCPACWGRRSPRPVCYTTIGLLEAALQWVSGGLHFEITQQNCHAMGHPNCTFHIPKSISA